MINKFNLQCSASWWVEVTAFPTIPTGGQWTWSKLFRTKTLNQSSNSQHKLLTFDFIYLRGGSSSYTFYYARQLPRSSCVMQKPSVATGRGCSDDCLDAHTTGQGRLPYCTIIFLVHHKDSHWNSANSTRRQVVTTKSLCQPHVHWIRNDPSQPPPPPHHIHVHMSLF